MPTLAVIVPATDAPPTLERCLAAIRAGHERPDELIVVDEPRSAGPAAARNVGAARAGADVLVFVDADVVLHVDALARIRSRFERDAGLAGVFGSYDDCPAEGGVVSVFRNLLHHQVHQEGSGPATTFWAGIGALRREDFLAVGGFDERRYEHPSVEDIELGNRLTRAGRRIELDPRIQGTHLKRWTVATMVHTDLVRRGVPWVRLLAAERSSSTALNLAWRHRLSALSALLAVGAAAARRFRPAVAGVAALLALNARLYRLFAQRQGAARLPLGVGLHLLHHLVGAASVAVGLARHLLDARARRRPG